MALYLTGGVGLYGSSFGGAPGESSSWTANAVLNETRLHCVASDSGRSLLPITSA